MPRAKTRQQRHDEPPQITDTKTPPDDSQSPHPDQMDLLDLLEEVTR